MRADKQLFKALEPPQLLIVAEALEDLMDKKLKDKDAPPGQYGEIWAMLRNAKQEMHRRLDEAYQKPHEPELLPP
jgi:hypothetical protein